jgi:transposase
MALYAQGMSYRRIAQAVGIHWTRVGQIIKQYESLR